MANQVFHSKLTIEAGTASTDAVTKSQLDTAEAAAKARANHTGTQTAATISDFNSAVDTRVQLIVDAAPAALDTLNELAAALGDDPNFSATVTTSLGDLDTRIDALEASSSAGSYKATVGNATDSTFTVTHNLGSTDVRVEVVQLSNGQTVYPVVTRPSSNTVAVDFGTTVPANNSHRVLVTLVP
jgi:hypothetical protein